MKKKLNFLLRLFSVACTSLKMCNMSDAVHMNWTCTVMMWCILKFLSSFCFPSLGRDVYPFLERLCLEGTRAQSKSAVSAISTLAGTSGHFWFSKLCKVCTIFSKHCYSYILLVLGYVTFGKKGLRNLSFFPGTCWFSTQRNKSPNSIAIFRLCCKIFCFNIWWSGCRDHTLYIWENPPSNSCELNF